MSPALRLLLAVWASLWLGGWVGPGAGQALAHPMPESRAWIDSRPDGWRLTLQLPLNRLEYAFGQPLADDPAQVLARHGEALAQYLLLHVGARSGTQGWQALRPQLQVEGDNASAELHAVMTLRAPPGADPRRATLLLDAVVHEVRTHRIQVFVRQDWAGGQGGSAPRLLGTLDSEHPQLAVDLGQTGSSVLQLLQAGMAHLAEGSDHLLFLWLLLVVAPLEGPAPGWVHRWGPVRAPRDALRHVVGVVSSFTLGHSLTLLLASTGLLRLPSDPIEVAVALTIVGAAVHAWRPIWGRSQENAGPPQVFLTPSGGLAPQGRQVWGRSEAWMAAGLGLVHGLAFANSLQGAGLSPWQHAQALLAFNLGIELMQLLVLAAVLPPLLVLARRAPGAYQRLRQGSSGLGGALAVVWVVQRLQLWWPA